MELASWFQELKRRKVFRPLIAYGIVAFAVLQVIEPVMHGLGLPEWVLSGTVMALGVGFALTLVLSWVFDWNGGRIERTRRAPLPRSASAGPSAQSPSIAVLPFADLSPGKDQDWMCDGIAEEIIDSFQFKGKATDVQAMAECLGVATLLEGSVRKMDDRLRVSARLVSSDGYELWADRLDRRLQDAFAIQEEIARAVVSALRLRMSSDEAGRLRRGGPASPQAYEMYLRGRQYFRALGGENVEMAREMFKRAIAIDPSFAQPQAGLADADINLVQWLLVPADAQPALRAEALEASETALRLDPDLPEGHVARANVLSILGRNDEADQSFRRATALAPGLRDGWYWYGRFLFTAGRNADAVRAYEEAARSNPDDYE